MTTPFARGVTARLRILALACGVGGVTALASAGPAVGAEDWSKVVEAARKEGKVVLYTAFVGQPSTRAVAKAFQDKYGIPVEILEARASEIRERVRVEQAAGRFLADVIFTSDGQTKLYDRDDKSVDPLPVTPAGAKVKEAFRLKVPMAAVMTIPYGILVNTNLVKPGQEPASWTDLLDPKWKGKILADDTRAIGGGYLWMFVTRDKLGDAFHQKVAAQGPTLTRDQRESQRRVARGEFPVYIPFILTDTMGLKGLPVKAILPKEGAPYVLYGNALLKNAPHPNAAKVYIDFLQSPEVQGIYAREGHGVVIDGITDKVAADVRRISEVPLMGTTDSDRQKEMLDFAKQTYK